VQELSIANLLRQRKKGLKGYDGVKKTKGRKRHIIVDTQGFLLVPHVTAADVNDRPALENMTIKLKEKFPFLKKLWADMGYQGQGLKERMSGKRIELEIVRRPIKSFWVPPGVKDIAAYLHSIGVEVVEGFKVLPRRWVVERTFAWMGRYRRMSKDYEFLPQTQETMMLLTMTRTMLKRTVKVINQI
jgi:putative transposase